MADNDHLTPESRYARLLVVVASVLMGMGAGALISIGPLNLPSD